jgi:WD40 repeat protein
MKKNYDLIDMFLIKFKKKVVVGLNNGQSGVTDIDANNTVTQFFKHSAPVNKVLRINDNNLATASNDTTVKLWDINTGILLCSLNHSSAVKSMAVLPNGYLATGSCDKNVYLWNLTSGVVFKNLTGHTGCVNDVQYNPLIGATGSLVSVSTDTTLIVWDLSSFTNIKRLLQAGPISCLLILPLGQMVTGSAAIIAYDTSFTKLFSVNPPSAPIIKSMAMMLDGVTVACGMNDSTILIFNMSSKTFGQSLTGHTQQVNTLDLLILAPDNQPFLISGSDDGLVNVWDVIENFIVKSINFSSPVNSVAYLYDEIGISKKN